LQETCRNCLSDRLAWQPVPPVGKLMTRTVIRHSTDGYFQARRPIAMGTALLDAGPVVFARLAPDCTAIGARVRLFNLLDRGGEQVFVAMPEEANVETNVIGDPNRDIGGRTVLVTGGDGGIGRALVEAFVRAGAARVWAATRGPLPAEAAKDAVVRPLKMDITDPGSVAAAVAATGGEVEILVNNAGVTAISGLLDADTIDGARQEIEVNYLGTLNAIRGFAPAMKARGRGTIVNMLTVLAHVNLPSMGSYCASKAAALSMTQGVRAELMPWGVRVAAVFPSTVDTPASADSPPPKLRPAQVADAVIRQIRDGVEDAYPGRIAADLHAGWRESPKVVERELGMALPEPR
jgi:NAD(P)-dependent dehydrogenase (short-subunit alcohol dehydrogenase family)